MHPNAASHHSPFQAHQQATHHATPGMSTPNPSGLIQREKINPAIAYKNDWILFENKGIVELHSTSIPTAGYQTIHRSTKFPNPVPRLLGMNRWPGCRSTGNQRPDPKIVRTRGFRMLQAARKPGSLAPLDRRGNGNHGMLQHASFACKTPFLWIHLIQAPPLPRGTDAIDRFNSFPSLSPGTANATSIFQYLGPEGACCDECAERLRRTTIPASILHSGQLALSMA
ncbi:hypothetical protein QBC39DRAFT_338775 [Podospora conica]|nr:hypothetical protein QBC39DRAFT_338775 [Schizothecium conicum]